MIPDGVVEGNASFGYNVSSGEYGNLRGKGVLDPTKATRCALPSVASIASLILITDAMIAELMEAKPQTVTSGIGNASAGTDRGGECVDHRAIKTAYRRYSRFYDFCFGAVFQPGRRAILERMECRPGERILEVGVGTGLSLPLYPTNVRVTGIDISRHMLQQALARKERDQLDHVAELAVMDAEAMAFPDNSFDKVVAMYVASVVPDPERLVDEMRRVCRPHGQIIFVNHFHSRNPIVGKFESILAPLSKQLGFHPDFSLEHFLEQTGLSTIDLWPVNLFQFCTVVEARNDKSLSGEAPAPALAV